METRDQDRHSDNYRHFDSLIWQLPTWSTALFALAIAAAATALSYNSKDGPGLANGLQLDIVRSTGLVFALTSLIMFLLTMIFTKLRINQNAWNLKVNNIHDENHLPRRWYLLSGQKCLLALLALETGCLMSFSLVLGGYLPVCALPTSLGLIVLVLYLFFECGFQSVRREMKSKRSSRPKNTEHDDKPSEEGWRNSQN